MCVLNFTLANLLVKMCCCLIVVKFVVFHIRCCSKNVVHVHIYHHNLQQTERYVSLTISCTQASNARLIGTVGARLWSRRYCHAGARRAEAVGRRTQNTSWHRPTSVCGARHAMERHVCDGICDMSYVNVVSQNCSSLCLPFCANWWKRCCVNAHVFVSHSVKLMRFMIKWKHSVRLWIGRGLRSPWIQ